MATAIWTHQTEPDLRGREVGFHIPRAGQTQYPTGLPVTLLMRRACQDRVVDGILRGVRLPGVGSLPGHGPGAGRQWGGGESHAVVTVHSPSPGPRPAGSGPLALDAAGNAWVTCHAADWVDVLSPTDGARFSSLVGAYIFADRGSGHVWTLVADGGEELLFNVVEGGVPRIQHYRIPSRAGCLVCHAPPAGHALPSGRTGAGVALVLLGLAMRRIRC